MIQTMKIRLTNLVDHPCIIPLTLGMETIVSEEDYDELSFYTWEAMKARHTYYAVRHEDGRLIRMHRQIMGVDSTMVVDHRNHNGLNNLRSNLRACTTLQNSWNLPPFRNTSCKYKGVSLMQTGRYRAKIHVYGKSISLGCYKEAVDAAVAYDLAAMRYFGEYAYLNFLKRVDYVNTYTG